MTQQILSSSQAVANSTGIAIARVGPSKAGERWKIQRITVQSNSIGASKGTLYRGEPQTGQSIDNTRTANADTSETDVELRAPEYLSFQWENASIGAICIITCDGERYR